MAVFVLRRTIKTQRQLFAVERAQNYTATQLADHRRKAELDQQLKAQREDVKLQLDFQAKEASRQRELAAISDLLAAVHAMAKRYRQGLIAIEDLILQGDSAAMRWRMEMTNAALADEIWFWPHHLGQLAMDVYDLDQAADDHAARIAAYDVFLEALGALQTVGLSWPSSSPEKRDELANQLIAERVKRDQD